MNCSLLGLSIQYCHCAGDIGLLKPHKVKLLVKYDFSLCQKLYYDPDLYDLSVQLLRG